MPFSNSTKILIISLYKLMHILHVKMAPSHSLGVIASTVQM